MSFDKLKNDSWSPDAIAGRLKMENSAHKIRSIYQFIYTSPITKKLRLH
ncbi:IS30 family transposase domain protein [Candidatus Cyrtobacter comes]|uniref:IS30 family transposase domain protein n=1 Tax=Candidatus Cyrtobacter comes TaxID=675776 RepID=A0ABU5L804_9RICK|nr:IS30 family transposase domain protein [Candidatus Cyrtobacter comes]